MRIETPRLVLRELVPDDFAAAHAYASLPEVSRHDDWGPNTEQDTLDWLAHAMESARETPRSTWILAVDDRERGVLCGAASLEVDLRHRSGDFGCVLHPDWWRGGYGTEIGRALIGLGFEHLGLHRLTATCTDENVASIRGLERLGLQLEGRLRGHRLRGRFVDSLLYAVVAPG